MPHEVSTVSVLTSVIIGLALFCIFAFFHWVYPALCKKTEDNWPVIRKPTRSELEEVRNAVIERKLTSMRMHEELRQQAKVLNMDETELAISN